MPKSKTDKQAMQSGKVDPAKLDAAEPPSSKRKNRERPEPAAELRDWKEGADKRAHARPYPPGIMLEPAGLDQEAWTPPHNDESLWTLQLADAFGTRSHSVIATFLRQLEALCGQDYWDDEAQQWRLDEQEFNAALAIVNSVQPLNEMEAAFAAQMVAVHLMTMKVSARALRYDCDTRTAATAARLAKTFTGQLEILQSMRGEKPETHQTITVKKELHQHVHYHRGEEKSDGQPHERTATVVDQRPALPGSQSSGESLPLSSREGQDTLPNARRS